MTPEAQRIAIAEACGWKRYARKMGDSELVTWSHPEWAPAFSDDDLPDYTNDLNAIASAVNSLSSCDRRAWLCALNRVTLRDRRAANLKDTWFPERVATATAAQRCKAFLLTIGQWKE